LDKIGAFLTERLVTLLLLLVGAPSDLGAVQGDQIGRIFPIILLWAVFQKLQKYVAYNFWLFFQSIP
jgi:hypothetical protein